MPLDDDKKVASQVKNRKVVKREFRQGCLISDMTRQPRPGEHRLSLPKKTPPERHISLTAKSIS